MAQHKSLTKVGFLAVFVLIVTLLAGIQPVSANPQVGPWLTFLGGRGDDSVDGIALDGDGNIYVTGRSDITWGSPVRAFTSGIDAFVAKLDSSGNLIWSTFLGGNSNDFGCGIAVDGSGNVFITGRGDGTWGSPVSAFTSGTDAFAARLDSSGVLQWNTFLGGNSYEEGNGIVVDGSGNVFITGRSDATWGNSPKRNYTSGYDAFTASLDGSGVLQWNTFLGGIDNDVAFGIAVDGSGNVYVTGTSGFTWGSPVLAHQAGYGYDAFTARLDSDGVLQWNTFLGGNSSDEGHAIAADGIGDIYLTGLSYATWGSPVRTFTSGTDAFAARLDSSGVLQWNTFLGGSGDDFGRGIALGGGNIYVTGYSNKSWGTPVRAYAADEDAFAAKLGSDGVLQWDTFLGDSGDDSGSGVAVDSGGNVYITGRSDAAWGSPKRDYTSDYDAFTARLDSNGSIPFPEMRLDGNAIEIVSGDSTPDLSDYTDFGSTAIAGGSVDKTYSIKNPGDAPLTLPGSPVVNISGPNSADFTVTALPLSPVEANSGGTTFTITFNPSGKGLRTATISIANNDSSENPYTFAIQGRGMVVLTVSATGFDKIYDGATTANVSLSDDRAPGDVLITSYASASFADKSLGAGKTVSVSGITATGADAGNYTFNTTASTSANITARTLTVGSAGVDKVYDGTTTATVTLSDNRVSGDVLITSYAGASFNTRNFGTGKTVSVSGITVTGDDAVNYTFNTTASTTASITKRPVNVTAAADTKIYNGTTSSTGAPTIPGGSLQTGDTTIFTQTFNTKNVGTLKKLTPAGIVNDGNNGLNYSYTFSPAATGTITAMPIKVTAEAKSKIMQDPDPPLTYTVNPSLISGDVFSGSLTRVAGDLPGYYNILQGTLSAGSNYSITFAENRLTINWPFTLPTIPVVTPAPASTLPPAAIPTTPPPITTTPVPTTTIPPPTTTITLRATTTPPPTTTITLRATTTPSPTTTIAEPVPTLPTPKTAMTEMVTTTPFAAPEPDTSWLVILVAAGGALTILLGSLWLVLRR